jgi:hypothetical protein
MVLPKAQKAGLDDEGRAPSPALGVDVQGKLARFAAEITIPKGKPAFIAFDTAVTSPAPAATQVVQRPDVPAAMEPARLMLHLVPVEVPGELLAQKPKRDWANPAGHLDFRAVVSLDAGPWRHHAIDLNRRVFEAVTPDKVLYDLAGMKLKAIGFEVIQPVDQPLQVLVDNIRVFAMTPAAMKVDLKHRLAQVQSRLEALPAESPAAAYWRARVGQLARRIAEAELTTDGRAWQNLAGQLDTMLLAAHKWSLAGDGKQTYLMGIESSLRRVSGRHAMHAFRGLIADAVELQAAGNEYESFQLVLMPLSGHLKQVSVKCGELTKTDGPAKIAAANVVAYHQIEQKIQPSLRTTDDQVGWTPDALLPVDGPFDVGATDSKAIWVTVYTPPGTPAGKYVGKIAIAAADAPSRSVTVTLRVHDFDIPRVGRFRTQGHFALTGLEQWYGDNYTPEVRRVFYRLLLEHRFSPTSQYSRMLSPVPEDIPWVMRDGGNVILIGGYHNKPLEPERIDEWYKWLVDNDYVDQAIIYVGDETDDYEGIRAKAVTIRKNWPKMRIMVGGSKPRKELVGYVDVWDPITSGGNIYDFDAKSTAEAIDRGEEMFWYTCIGPRQPFANVCNDDPLTATRALWWQAWKYGITGFEYWALNYWGPNMALAGEGDGSWLDRPGQWNSRAYKWCNGDGLMVYPGPNGKPLSCIRFSVMRDAIEDWELLFMLARTAELASKLGDPQTVSLFEAAQKLLAVPGQITSDLTHWSSDPEVYLAVRKPLYDLLSTLRGRLGAKRVDEYIEEWVAKHQKWLQEKFEERVAKTRPTS